MWHRSKSGRALCAALALALVLPLVGYGQPQVPARPSPTPSKELIAVLDLDILGGSKAEGSVVTDRLREEMLKTGRVTLVDRSQIEAILNEQAFQQTGCTSQECAVQVGKILGVRRIVSGKVTKLSETLWQVSAQVVDVETAETLRVETILREGRFVELVGTDVRALAEKLVGATVATSKAPAAEFEDWERAQAVWNGERWSAWIAGGLLLAYGYAQAQAVSDSNAQQSKLLSQAQSATTAQDYATAKDRLKREEANAKDAKQQSDAAYVLGALGLGLAWWIQRAAPQRPAGKDSALNLSAWPAPGAWTLALDWRF